MLFKDLKAGAYYEKAVNRAWEEHITAGMSPDYFRPSGVCARGQIVTFL